MLNSEGNVFRDDWIFLNINAVNCEFWMRALAVIMPRKTSPIALFFRSGAGLWWNYAPANLSVQNCTFIGGSLDGRPQQRECLAGEHGQLRFRWDNILHECSWP